MPGYHPALSFAYAGAVGVIPGVERIVAFGRRAGVNTGVPADIWSGPTPLIQWPASPMSMYLVSSSASDNAAGAGARSVLIFYLDDASLVQKQVVVALNGTTPVPIPGLVFRINRVVVVTAGSASANIGAVTVIDGSPDIVFAHIPAGHSISKACRFSVPYNHTADILAIFGSVNSTTGAIVASAVVEVAQRPGWGSVVGRTLEMGLVSGGFSLGSPMTPLLSLVGPQDFWLGVSSVQQNNTDVSGAFLGVLRRHDVHLLV